MNSKIILVGGKSGCGKTTIINNLIAKYPNIYTRPLSYTTRKQRLGEKNDEYIFLTVEEFTALEKKGELLNVDIVYGNYYGMSSNFVSENLKNDLFLIKEVHPENHEKLKKKFNSNTISILFKSQYSESSRKDEDDEYYDSINEDFFDIIFFNDKDQSVEINAKYLHNKIMTYAMYCNEFPSAGIIDSTNREGYNKVAKYFTEEKRITTRNFHELSIPFFENIFNNYVNDESHILEVGPGQGWLRATVNTNCKTYFYADISKEMSDINSSTTNKIVTSVRCIPYPTETFDIILSSLGDPYFYPEAFCEFFRLLKSDGYLAFSLPAKQWASFLRSDLPSQNKTKFILDTGDVAEVFSFSYSIDEIKGLLKNIGFELIFAESIKAGSLTNEVSPAIISASQKGNIDYKELETVTVAIFKKES